MKLFVVLSLLLCSAVAQDLLLLLKPPVVSLSARTPRLLMDRLPRKTVDPTAMIRVAARKHKVRPALVKGIVAAESAFNANAISPKGAVGLMQLMPATALAYGADPLVPEENIEAGTRYLRVLIQKYGKYRNGLQRAIAAYN